MGGNFPPVKNNVKNQTFTPEEASFGIPMILDFVSGGIAAKWAMLNTPFTLEVTPNNYKSNMAAIGFAPSDSHWKHVATMADLATMLIAATRALGEFLCRSIVTVLTGLS